MHTSGAFFLTFHDATYHMRVPFEYLLRIAWFLFSKLLFFGEILEHSKKQPFTKQKWAILNEYSNGALIW